MLVEQDGLIPMEQWKLFAVLMLAESFGFILLANS
jgi:hypothetical protein